MVELNAPSEAGAIIEATDRIFSDGFSSPSKPSFLGPIHDRYLMSKTTEFDPASYLDSGEVIAEYLNLALASGETDFLLSAIGDVAKAKGMAQVARDAGLERKSLYQALRAGGKPRFETVLKVLKALGVQMQAHPLLHRP